MKHLKNIESAKLTWSWLRFKGVHILGVTYILSLMLGIVSCSISDNKKNTFDTENNKSAITDFFGDSVLTIISSNRPNGYLVKIFHTRDMTLLNLSRGDSINKFLSIHEIPLSVENIRPDTIGTVVREINIPLENELASGLFFMDVNFDGEEELILKYPGYNRSYYACFDIVKGVANVTPGILQPMNEPPYNNIVTGDGDIYGDIYTKFDYDNKTIHIFEQMGCCSHQETWCEMVSDYEFDPPKVRIVRREDVDYTSDGHIITTIYKRVDGELKEVSSTRKEM